MLDQIFNAMAEREGFFKKGTLPQRANNPLDLRFAGQEGAVCSVCETTDQHKPCTTGKPYHGIAWFDSIGRGKAAGYLQLSLWAIRGLTLQEMIHTQAPPNENDTASYLNFVIGKTNIPATAKISDYL